MIEFVGGPRGKLSRVKHIVMWPTRAQREANPLPEGEAEDEGHWYNDGELIHGSLSAAGKTVERLIASGEALPGLIEVYVTRNPGPEEDNLGVYYPGEGGRFEFMERSDG